MADQDKPDQEPAPASSGNNGSSAENTQRKKNREILTKGRAALTENELASTGVLKLLIDELDRLQDEVEKITPYISRYHEADKNLAILKEQEAARQNRKFVEELLSTGTLSVGFGLLGLIPSMTNNEAFFFAGSAALIAIGVLAKWKLK